MKQVTTAKVLATAHPNREKVFIADGIRVRENLKGVIRTQLSAEEGGTLTGVSVPAPRDNEGKLRELLAWGTEGARMVRIAEASGQSHNALEVLNLGPMLNERATKTFVALQNLAGATEAIGINPATITIISAGRNIKLIRDEMLKRLHRADQARLVGWDHVDNHSTTETDIDVFCFIKGTRKQVEDILHNLQGRGQTSINTGQHEFIGTHVGDVHLHLTNEPLHDPEVFVRMLDNPELRMGVQLSLKMEVQGVFIFNRNSWLADLTTTTTWQRVLRAEERGTFVTRDLLQLANQLKAQQSEERIVLSTYGAMTQSQHDALEKQWRDSLHSVPDSLELNEEALLDMEAVYGNDIPQEVADSYEPQEHEVEEVSLVD